MSKYVSIRGWIECEYEDIEKIKDIVETFKKEKKWLIADLDKESLKLYQTAWHFPKKELNWTAYVFFGADINYGYYNYIKEQVEEISKINEDIVGYFQCSDEERVEESEWHVESGILSVKNCNND